MRLQLHSKRVQASLGEVSFQTLQTQLTGNIAIVVMMCLPGPQNQPIDEPVPQKQASQRIDENLATKQAIPFTNPDRGTDSSQDINVHRRHQQAWKEMRQNSPTKLLARNGDLPVYPKNQRRDHTPGPPQRER